MNKLLLALCLTTSLISLSACAEHAGSPSTRAVFMGQQISLIDDQGQCTLVKPDQSHLKLDMEWPCGFGLDKQQKLRVEVFNKTPIFAVWRSDHMPAPGRDCLSKMQAIRQMPEGFQAGTVSLYAACGSGGDQKMYVAPFTW